MRNSRIPANDIINGLRDVAADRSYLYLLECLLSEEVYMAALNSLKEEEESLLTDLRLVFGNKAHYAKHGVK